MTTTTVHKARNGGVFIKESDQYYDKLTRLAEHDVSYMVRIQDRVEIHFNSEYRDTFRTAKLNDAKAFFNALLSAVLGIDEDEAEAEAEEEKP
jgi:hypothetical protein